MENKINAYIKYIFNLNNIKDEEMYLEISTNLNERYHSLLTSGLTEDEAYLKTIDTLGDFNFNDPHIDTMYQYKPNWANISLFVSLGLGVLATIILFISSAVSALFTGVSIALYIGSAYYLYHMSQYALKTLKDINKHNELLKGIFKNLKTTFVFWNINISYWLTSTIIGFISLGTPLTQLNNPDQLSEIIFIYFALFSLIFIVLLLVFKSIYKNIESKYYELTQQEKLQSYAKEINVFKLDNTSVKILIFIGKSLIILLYVLIILLLGIQVQYKQGSFGATTSFSLIYNEFNNKLGSTILIVLTIIVGLYTAVTFATKKKVLSIIGIISLTTLHITSLIYISSMFLSDKYFEATQKNIPSINIINIISILVMGIFLILSINSHRKEKRHHR